MMYKKTIRYAFFSSLPVMAGYVVLGAGFGILLNDKGYSFWWAFLMSLTIYAGSMQYVGVDLMAGGASLVSAALITLMVNARHIFYGVSMVDKYREAGPEKPYLIFALTDETYSLVCDAEVPEGVSRRWYYFLVSLMNQFYWIFGSVLGGILGSALTFDTEGIDFAMTALFVVIFLEQWLKEKHHASEWIGLAASVGCLLLFGADNFLVPTMICILAALTALRRPLEKERGVTAP